MKVIKELYVKYKDIVVYLFFGVLTTIVNYLVYLPVYNLLHINAAISNVIAWVAAVAFAFLTNKPFVFNSRDWSKDVVIPELIKFVGCRIGSGITETLILLLTVDIIHLNGNVMKLVTNIIVVVLNYFGSKFLVFKD